MMQISAVRHATAAFRTAGAVSCCRQQLSAIRVGVAASGMTPRGVHVTAPTCSQAAPRDHPSGITLYGEGKGTGLDIPASRPSYYQPSPLNVTVHKYYYLLKAFGMFSRKAQTGTNSEDIYRSIEEQATQDVWWEALGLPRNWITEQALISLHIWLFHNRFKVDYNVAGLYNGRRMQEELFERFWHDTTVRIRNAGIAEISVNKQLENVQKITFDDMFSYDAAIKADAAAEGDGSGADAGVSSNMELSAALWKGVFREDENADTEAVLRLADYTRRELLNLLTQPKEDVYRGWITWGPCVGETDAGRAARQRRMLEGEWREALHLDGRVYFYHTSTQEVRWDPPTEGLYARRRFALARFLEQKEAEKQAALPAGASKEAAAKPLAA